ncbi:hypothetical protein [Nostoc sp. CHAB 5836]|nr:hypothetical protein [Nostoc sp. CHAB 5836]
MMFRVAAIAKSSPSGLNSFYKSVADGLTTNKLPNPSRSVPRFA